jgi:NAD(P)-dependent dehydrogenase (short-subunit alcohol dehydrogenase family)
MICVDTSSAHTASALAGKTIVVTGASGHVGWGIALAALDAGANVVLPVRSEASRAAVERDHGNSRAFVPTVDFRDERSLAGMRDATVQQFGGVAHVITPLGSCWQKGSSLDQPGSEMSDLLSTYVEAQWLLVKTFAPALRQSQGTYTFITSAAGEADYISGAGLLVVAAKAQLALSAVLRRELADEPFRVNEVRISRRIERAHRPGVIPARVAGAALLKAITISVTGRLLRYDGSQLMLEDE